MINQQKAEYLTILVDLNTIGWFQQQKSQQGKSELFDIIDLIEIFIYQLNLFYLQNSNNQGFLFIFDECQTLIVFPQNQEDRNIIKKLDFLQIKNLIINRVFGYLQNKIPQKKTHSVFLSSYFRALCLLNKLIKQNKNIKTYSRILTIINSEIEEKQCLNLMNCIQTAKSLNIISDSLNLNKKKQNFLTQISSKTKGLFLPAPPEINKSIVEYFVNAFFLNIESRKQFKLPYISVAHYEAVCFCHKQHIDKGYICSSCLGIYCQNPNKIGLIKCKFCNTRFDPFLEKELKIE